MILEIDTKKQERLEIDIERIKESMNRFNDWAKDNNCDCCFEEFIELNLELIGY